MRGEEGCRSPQTGLQSLEPHIYGAAINGLWTATIYIYIYIYIYSARWPEGLWPEGLCE